MGFIFKLVVSILAIFLTDFLTYKFIRSVDIKTRNKIDKYELDQVDKLVERFEKIGVKSNESSN